MTRIEPRDVQHLTFCRKGAAALKVDDGTPIRRNHSNLREINLNALEGPSQAQTGLA